MLLCSSHLILCDALSLVFFDSMNIDPKGLFLHSWGYYGFQDKC